MNKLNNSIKMTNKQLLIYCGILFLISWALQIVTIYMTDDLSSSIARLGLAAAMVSPLIVSIGFILTNKSLKSKILWKPNKHFCITALSAILIPTLTAFIVLLVMKYLNYGHSGWFEFSSNGTTISGGPFLLGVGYQNWILFCLNILLTATVYSLLTGMIAIGEEFAWRGLLQGMLIERFGIIKGVAILGFLWAMWHLPIQLAGYNFPENPILGSFIISPLMLIAVSFFYAWLTLKSNSFLPAAIGHGAFNTIEEGIISNINLQVPMLYLILVKLIITGLTGLLFLYFIKRKYFTKQL
jgi:membrane protease YdiL (CAAX protease family)